MIMLVKRIFTGIGALFMIMLVGLVAILDWIIHNLGMPDYSFYKRICK